jgi:hypothetical protein
MDRPFMPPNLWDPGNFYPAGETVQDGDAFYQAIRPVPAGTPITDTTYWAVITNPATVGDKDSTRPKDLAINDAILTQSYEEVPLSGYDNGKFYILPTLDGEPASYGVTSTSSTNVSSSNEIPTDGDVTPQGFGYTMGYLTGSRDPNTGYLLPPNGLPVTPGVSFPPNPSVGDYALRLDYFPNRLFRFNGKTWIKIEENVRTDLDLAQGALTQRASFVNNPYTVPTTDLGNIPSRQSLSEILKPQADNGDDGGNKPPNPRPPGR